MKIIISNYTFNAAAKTVAFNDYGSILLDNVLIITNVVDNLIIYQFSNPLKGGSVAGNVLTLEYDTTAMSNTDALQIWFYDENAVKKVSAVDLDIRDLVFATDKVDVTGSVIGAVVSGAGIPAGLGQAAMAASMPVVIASDQSALRVEDIIQTIQLTGQYHGKTAYVFNLLGQRAGFTSATIHNAIKEYDNTVADIANTNNSTLDIISSNVNDAAAGTGVRTVKVVYIDSSNNLVESAAITLNGTTLVTSVLTGVNQVLWMETATVGSGLVAAGNIRLRINGGTVEVEQITATNNKSRSAVFMIPAGYTGYIVNWRLTSIGNQQAGVLLAQVNTLDRTFSTVYHTQSVQFAPANTNMQAIPDLWLKIPALARVKASTLSQGLVSTVICSVNIQFVIIAD